MTGLLGRIQDLFQLGGPVIVILLVLSIVALAIVFLKIFQFARIRINDRRFIKRTLALYRSGETQAALDNLEKRRNPIARVLEVAITWTSRRGTDHHLVREEAERVAVVQLENLRSHLRALEVIATLSPLLGLFGTVLGMIEAFQRLEEAGSRVNPSILSGGIWEALLTTAAGLAVAIPAVAMLNWFERSIHRLAHDMEDAVTQVFTMPLAQPSARDAKQSAISRRSLFD